MNDKYNLIAFESTLLSIVVLVLAGAIMAINGKPYEALGIGGAVTGLIGVIGTFKPRTPSGPDGPAGTAADPLSVVGADNTDTAPPVKTVDTTGEAHA